MTHSPSRSLLEDLRVNTRRLRRHFATISRPLGVTDLKPEPIIRQHSHRNDPPIYRDLPPPKNLTMGLTDALKARSTHRAFSDEPLTDEDLATILWAADGINRPDGRRTTPSSLNWREVDIYVLKANGTWRYEPEGHRLRFIDLPDLREETLFAQPFLKSAPVQLVMVSDVSRTESRLMRFGKKLAKTVGSRAWSEDKIDEMMTRSMTIDAAVKVQAVYLACAALDNVGCVCRTGFDQTALMRVLPINENQTPVLCMTVGYKAKRWLDTIM